MHSAQFIIHHIVNSHRPTRAARTWETRNVMKPQMKTRINSTIYVVCILHCSRTVISIQTFGNVYSQKNCVEFCNQCCKICRTIVHAKVNLIDLSVIATSAYIHSSIHNVFLSTGKTGLAKQRQTNEKSTLTHRQQQTRDILLNSDTSIFIISEFTVFVQQSSFK